MIVRLILKSLPVVLACLVAVGCHSQPRAPKEQTLGPPYDRPFPLGQVTDAHWETQQTNAEAADFIFYDHEFEGRNSRMDGLQAAILSTKLRHLSGWLEARRTVAASYLAELVDCGDSVVDILVGPLARA